MVETAGELGLDYRHVSGATGELYIAEAMGAGIGLEDLDGDGDLDLYLVQGGPLTFQAVPDGPGDRVYRNLLAETGGLQFEDTTRQWEIDARGYGMGIAIDDVDGDGRVDLFLTNLGADQLWLQAEPGRFRKASFPGSETWSVSASFADLDGDRRPDLYVTNYVGFHPGNHRPCYGPSSALDYCGPQVYPAVADQLFANRDGSLVEVTRSAGIDVEFLPGLGVVAHDFDEDGWADLFVANDAEENLLWINQRDGTFRNEALLRGVAVNRKGEKEAGMGIALGDVDHDRDADLLVTHLEGETNTFYRNEGRGLFSDQTIGSGLGAPSHPQTSFGAGFLHLNGDSHLDLLVVSGAVKRFRERAAEMHDLAQPDQTFVGHGDGRFEELAEGLGSLPPLPSRGAAFGDLDNDGDLDVVVNAKDSPARLYLNQLPPGPWIGFLPIEGSRVATGTRIELHTAARTLTAWSRRDGSYASSNDPRVLFRLEKAEELRAVVTWPDGARESWSGLVPNRYVTLVRGFNAESPTPSDAPRL